MKRIVKVVVTIAVLLTALVQELDAQTATEFAVVDTTLAGTWITRGPEGITTLSIALDGVYLLDLQGDGSLEVQGVIASTGRQLEISDTGGALVCPNPGNYTFQVDKDGTLRFTSVDDKCEGRRMTIALVEWADRDHVDQNERAILDDPKNANAYLSRGRIRLIQGDADSAITDLNRALELDPRNVRAYAARAGYKIMYRQDLEGALTDFNRAIELSPEDGLRYFQRAWTKYYLGDITGTCSDLHAAIERGLQVQNKYDENCR